MSSSDSEHFLADGGGDFLVDVFVGEFFLADLGEGDNETILSDSRLPDNCLGNDKCGREINKQVIKQQQ